jgi:hypothetical protein
MKDVDRIIESGKCTQAEDLPARPQLVFTLTLIRMTKDEKALAIFKGLML